MLCRTNCRQLRPSSANPLVSYAFCVRNLRVPAATLLAGKSNSTLFTLWFAAFTSITLLVTPGCVRIFDHGFDNVILNWAGRKLSAAPARLSIAIAIARVLIG